MEKYQILQSIFGCLSLLFTLLAAIFGFLWNYYGGLIDDVRSEQQKAQTENSKNRIIEKVDSSSEKLSKEIHAVSKKPVFTKTETTINAPNAQIVTSGQSGGNNTVVNNLDQPLPKLNFNQWDIKNNKVDKIIPLIRIKRDQFIPIPKEAGVDILFYNKFTISYYSEVNRNQIGIRIKKNDVVKAFISTQGLIQFASGHDGEKNFVFMLTQPSSGIYTLSVYTKSSIKNLNEVIDYLK